MKRFVQVIVMVLFLSFSAVLTAQAAEQVGDRAKAEEAYKRLLSDERTRFVGVRGLMQQKLENLKMHQNLNVFINCLMRLMNSFQNHNAILISLS